MLQFKNVLKQYSNVLQKPEILKYINNIHQFLVFSFSQEFFHTITQHINMDILGIIDVPLYVLMTLAAAVLLYV